MAENDKLKAEEKNNTNTLQAGEGVNLSKFTPEPQVCPFLNQFFTMKQ